MAPVRGKWLACKPCTEVPWSVDGPFGDLRRDAKPPGQFSVGEEPQRPGEQSSEARRQVVFDVPGRPLGSDLIESPRGSRSRTIRALPRTVPNIGPVYSPCEKITRRWRSR